MRRFIAFALCLSSSSVAQAQLAPSFQEAVRSGRQVLAPKVVDDVEGAASRLSFAPVEQGLLSLNYLEQTNYLYAMTFDTSLSRRMLRGAIWDGIQDFVNLHADMLGVQVGDLDKSKLRLTDVDDAILQVSVPEVIAGVPIDGAYLDFSFAKLEGDVLALRDVTNRTFGGVPLVGPPSATVSLLDLQALTGLSDIRVTARTAVIHPAYEAGSLALYNATSLTVHDAEHDEDYTLTLRNDDLSLLEAFQHKIYESTLRAEVYKRSYLDQDKILVPLDRTTLALDGTTFTTDLRGMFDREPSGSATVALSSSIVRITDGGRSVSLARTFDQNTGSVVSASDNELRALNAFAAIHRVNKFVRQQIKAAESAYLRQPLTVAINVAGSCNAFYDGNISLFRAGGGCANMALVDDVIMHEWGHGLDAFTGRTLGINDSAYSEGIGDILAGYFAGSSNMGTGFFTDQATGIRSLANTRRAPTDLNNEPHNDGLIIGGAFWDLRAALIERYGEVKGTYKANYFFLRHLLVSDSYREALAIVLNLDDDDANPATRSPNFCLINAAFAKHGLSSQAACSDAVIQNPYTVDESTTLTFVDDNGTDYGIAVSTEVKDTKGAYLCLNGTSVCTGTARVDFGLEGQTDKRLFFTSKVHVTFADYQLVTVVFTDEAGAVRAGRAFKLAPQ